MLNATAGRLSQEERDLRPRTVLDDTIEKVTKPTSGHSSLKSRGRNEKRHTSKYK